MSKQVVLAIFPDEAAADAAVVSLKSWDKASDDVKLNAIGVLVLGDDGKIKTDKLGRRSVGAGAGVGLVLSLVTPMGLAAGVVGGGLLGALHRKGLGIKGDDRDRIAKELSDGKAAVGVLVKTDEADTVAAKLNEFGGKVEVHEVSDQELEEAHEADTVTQAG
jgi:uncharacterized membrane protein